MAHIVAQLGYTFLENRRDEALFRTIEIKPLSDDNWQVMESRGIYAQRTTKILL